MRTVCLLAALLAAMGVALGFGVARLAPGTTEQRELVEKVEAEPSTQPRVVRIVDGDTIVVARDGAETKVRLLNIDTPERDECLFKEATAHLTSIIAPGDSVTLEYDRERQDRYGRDLAAVYTGDGLFVNERMVTDGFARSVEYEPNTKYSTQMQEAERQAKNDNLGIHDVGVECLLPDDISRNALDRYKAEHDPFYLDVMRDAVESKRNFTYREQALDLINSL